MPSSKLYNKDGDAKAANIQKGLEKKLGFLPEAFQVMGRNGDFLEAMLQLHEVAGKGLDPKTKELIALAVSAVNGCVYCFDAHRAFAKQAGVSDEEITAALEVVAQMSAFNNFNKAISLNSDIK
ncbi:MAG: carboxymuconolactone decarboxylase family protein [Lentisphaeria bacterium]